MITLEEFSKQIKPDRTVILFGAGASIPSGAPSAASLAQILSKKLGKPSDLLLSEICSIYEKALGRRDLSDTVVEQLKDLVPTGGLLLLPEFNWHRLYSTNYDRLIEKAYLTSKTRLDVLVSNSDFSRETEPGTLQYLKLHGDIGQDVGFGHQIRMLLTESDYENYADFREAAFNTLQSDMSTKDILIIGQSLADPHLRNLVNKITSLHQQKNLPGRVMLLTYSNDPDRAGLWEDRGITVASGGIDDFMQLLINNSSRSSARLSENDTSSHALPPELLPSTVDISHAASLKPNPQRLFNGMAASYADIASDLTFRRTALSRARKLLTQEKPNLALIGSAGVGKTTLARQICLEIIKSGGLAWEHKEGFPFAWRSWLELERKLAKAGLIGVIYIDDCVTHLTQINLLLSELGRRDQSHLRVIVTAQSGAWRARNKSPRFFAEGNIVRVSRLGDSDMNSLLNLISEQPSIRELVDPSFSILSRHEQVARLRERCAADMYVCLKNIFASEELDNILLREYAELKEDERDIYRHVSALESIEAKVHRQLIIRSLQVDTQTLQSFLIRMDGILFEYDIKPADGLYGWSTRHGVVAKTIATYKFHDQQEIFDLFQTIIGNLNPNEWLEKDLARSMCQEEFGIHRLIDRNKQLQLLRSLVSLLPGDKVIRHRLVKQYLDMDLTDDAAREIKTARKYVGNTSTLARYGVYLLLRRAEETEGILDEDRVALLRDAERQAIQNLSVKPYSDDIHNYKAFGHVGEALAKKGQGLDTLEEAIRITTEAEDKIFDPLLTEFRRHMENRYRVLKSRAA